MNIQTIRSFVSRSRLYQGLLRLWYNNERIPRVASLLQSEFTESDLYRQANCLHAAGYKEAAVLVGNIAIRRSLRKLLASCPGLYLSDLPKKTSSRKQYATHEMAYFFYGKGVIGVQLRRALASYQKKVDWVTAGVKLGRPKAQEMMDTVNVLRPQLEQAMGRVKFDLPPLERSGSSPPPLYLLVEVARQLSKDLSLALGRWHQRVFPEAISASKDPISVLTDLRARSLISREKYKVGCKLYKNPEEIGLAQAKLLQGLMDEATGQADSECRKLSDNERFMIGTMIGRGARFKEVNDRFGIQVTENGTGDLGDSLLVEDAIINSAANGSAACLEVMSKTLFDKIELMVKNSGFTFVEIGECCGVSCTAVSQIARGKHYHQVDAT